MGCLKMATGAHKSNAHKYIVRLDSAMDLYGCSHYVRPGFQGMYKAWWLWFGLWLFAVKFIARN